MKKLLKIFIPILFLFQTFCLNAYNIPTLTGHVNDYAHILDSRKSQIEDKLTALEDSTSAQVVILTIPMLPEGTTIEEYSIAVTDSWKLGQKGKDNGVLVTVALNDHRMRIEVGYGLEGVIPDAVAKLIISRKMTPKFKENDYAGGILDAVNDICSLISNDETIKTEYTNYSNNEKNEETDEAEIGLIIFLCIIFLFGNTGCSILSGIFFFLALNNVIFHGHCGFIWLYILLAILYSVFSILFKEKIMEIPVIGFPFRIVGKFTDFIHGIFGSSSFGGGGGRSSGGSSWSSGGGYSGGGGHFGGGGASGSW